MQVSANGQSMVGSEAWTWAVEGDDLCTDGTSSVSAVRLSGG